MSQRSIMIDRGAAVVEGRSAEVVAQVRDALLAPLEAAAFWAAVVLPFLHVPLLLTGLESGGQVLAFLSLLVLNVVAVLLGHSHHRD